MSLKPGHSLMDWIRLTHSGKDLAGCGGEYLEVSQHELSKHNTRQDAWIAIGGRVYNITHYLEYHPGGEDEIMRGAGKDATDIFNQIHMWVNVKSMLQNCFVGILKKTWVMDVPRFTALKSSKAKQKRLVNNLDVKIVNQDADHGNILQKSSLVPECSVRTSDYLSSMNVPGGYIKLHSIITTLNNKYEQPVFHMPESDISLSFKETDVFIMLQVKGSNVKHQGFITDLINNQMFMKTSYSFSCILNIKFPIALEKKYKVEKGDNQSINIICMPDKAVKKVDVMRNISWSLWQPKMEFIYWPCKLVRKISLNYNTILATFSFPSGMNMWVPLGYHVRIKSYIRGMHVIRNYTPVTLSLEGKSDDCGELNGSEVSFIIKVYKMGTMTQFIDNISLGDDILISNYTGNFTVEMLSRCESVIMFAAGTGITPMVKVIRWLIETKDKKRSVLLLFFNRTEEDIIWRNEFQSFAASYSQFKIVHILAEPNKEWCGMTGQLNEKVFQQLLNLSKEDKSQHFLACGPVPFVKIVLRCLESVGVSEEAFHIFSGL